MNRPDYLGKLLLAIDRARPWNGASILTPYTEGFEGFSEYSINAMPMFRATSYIACLTRHTRERRSR